MNAENLLLLLMQNLYIYGELILQNSSPCEFAKLSP